MLSADFIISAKLWLLFPKIKILSSAEHSDERVKHFFPRFVPYDQYTSCRLSVTPDFTSFVLCCYVIGLFNRPQANFKQNGKECYSDVSSRFYGGSVA